MNHLVAAALAVLLLTASGAQAGPPFACCVCEAAESALFCAAVPSSEITEFTEDCDDDGGLAASCSAAVDPSQCAAVFEGAECPAAAGPVAAPAAGPAGVLALALVLAGVGAGALRRRRPRA